MIDWLEKTKSEKNDNLETLSFSDYMSTLEENPRRQMRASCRYFYDMFHHFGVEEDGSFKIFQEEDQDSPAVYGHKSVQRKLVQNLINFEEEGFNNKFILLVGPNGSSKSSLVKKIIKGLEVYGHKKEGALYTFSWIFPIDPYLKGSLGLTSREETKELQSFAYLEDKEISAILNSELKDHPLLLIPKIYRQELLDDLFKDDQEYLTDLKLKQCCYY